MFVVAVVFRPVTVPVSAYGAPTLLTHKSQNGEGVSFHKPLLLWLRMQQQPETVFPCFTLRD